MMATWGQGITLKGAKGDAGLSVLTGTGAPANTLGYDTQAYISDAGDLYFRNNGAWALNRSLVGPIGMNGYSGQLLFGTNAPTSATYSGPSDALYIQSTGEVWSYDAEGAKTWVDTGYSFLGPQGVPGVAGQRGTQTYTGNGAPSSNLASFGPVTPAVAGDLYYDVGTVGGPFLYILGN